MRTWKKKRSVAFRSGRGVQLSETLDGMQHLRAIYFVTGLDYKMRFCHAFLIMTLGYVATTELNAMY